MIDKELIKIVLVKLDFMIMELIKTVLNVVVNVVNVKTILIIVQFV